MLTVRCICIDDKNKPNEIPTSRWIKHKEIYHITHIYYHPIQNVKSVLLKEVSLDSSCAPYEAYILNRFAIFKEDLDKFKALIKQCNDLSEININKLLEETEIKVTI